MAVLGLHFCARALSSCGERGPLFIAVRGPLTIAAPPVAGHRLQTRRLSNCGSRAQLLRGIWDLPRPGLEPVSPALAGRFSTTAPPGKPKIQILYLGLQEPSKSVLSTCTLTLILSQLPLFTSPITPRPGVWLRPLRVMHHPTASLLLQEAPPRAPRTLSVPREDPLVLQDSTQAQPPVMSTTETSLPPGQSVPC